MPTIEELALMTPTEIAALLPPTRAEYESAMGRAAHYRKMAEGYREALQELAGAVQTDMDNYVRISAGNRMAQALGQAMLVLREGPG